MKKATNAAPQKSCATSPEPAYRVSEPTRTITNFTVFPKTGGLYCRGGKELLRVGADIKSESGWEVYYVPGPGVPERLIPASAWVVGSESPSIPCVAIIEIGATVDGAPMQCRRTVTFANVETDGNLDELRILTNPQLPGGYFGKQYKAYIEAEGKAGIEVEWKMEGAPAWLSLVDSPDPRPYDRGHWRVALVGTPPSAWTGSVRVTVTSKPTDVSGAESSTTAFQVSIVYPPDPQIITDTLGTWVDTEEVRIVLRGSGPEGFHRKWSVTPALPGSLVLDQDLGTIIGYPERVYDRKIEQDYELSLECGGRVVKKTFHVTTYRGLKFSTNYLPVVTATNQATYSVPLEIEREVSSGLVWHVSVGNEIGLNDIGFAQAGDGRIYRDAVFPLVAGRHIVRVSAITRGLCTCKVFELVVEPRVTFVAGSLPEAVVSKSYVGTVDFLGRGPLTVISGALPNGLTLAPGPERAWALTGVPTHPGLFAFQIATENAGDAKWFSLYVASKPVVMSGSTLPSAMVGVEYSAHPQVSGTIPIYRNIIDPDAFPQGLVMDGVTGAISGVPDSHGAYSFGVMARGRVDGGSMDATVMELTVRDQLKFTTETTLPNAATGKPYTAQIQVAGSQDTDRWSAVGLPDGLTIDPVTGSISGKPTVPPTLVKTYVVKITVSTPEGGVLTGDFTISMNVGPVDVPEIMPEVLPEAQTHTDFFQQLTLINSSESPVFWLIEQGGALPEGFSLNSWSGTLTGYTDTALSAPVNFTVVAMGVDQSGTPSRVITKRGYTLNVVEKPPQAVIVPATLKVARVGHMYSETLSIVQKNIPDDGIRWVIADPAPVPAWLTLNMYTGELSGVPDEVTSFGFKVFAYRIEGELISTIASSAYALTVVSAPQILTEALNTAVDGEPYPAQTLTLSTEKPTGFDWMIFPPEPTWLKIDPTTGVLSSGQTPAVYREVPYSVNIIVASHTGGSISSIYAEKLFHLTVSKEATIVTASPLPTAMNEVAYQGVTIQVVPPKPDGYHWAFNSEKPEWLSIDANSGVLSGTPTGYTEDTTLQFEIAVVQDGATSEQPQTYAYKLFELSVKHVPAPGSAAILPKPNQLQAARVDDPYCEDFRVENAPEGEIRFGISSPTNTSIPAGLKFDQVGGSLYGELASVPFIPYEFTVTAYHGSARLCSENYVLQTKQRRQYPEILPQACINEEYTFTVTPEDTHADDTDRWSAEGLPNGLTIDPATGSISGAHTRTYSPNPAVEGATDRETFTHRVTIIAKNADDVEYRFTRNMLTGPRVKLQTHKVDNIVCHSPPEDADAFEHTIVPVDMFGNTVSDIVVSILNSEHLPDGLAFNQATNKIAGIPTYIKEGEGHRIYRTERHDIRVAFTSTLTGNRVGVDTLSLTTVAPDPKFYPAIDIYPEPQYLVPGRVYTFPLELTPSETFDAVTWEIRDSESSGVIRSTGKYTAELTLVGGQAPATGDFTVVANYRDASSRVSYLSDATIHCTTITSSGGTTIREETLPIVYPELWYETKLTALRDNSEVAGTWILHPDSPLPDGLTLDASTGTISGMIAQIPARRMEIRPTVVTPTGTDTRTVILPIGTDFDGPTRFREHSLTPTRKGVAYEAFVTIIGRVRHIQPPEWTVAFEPQVPENTFTWTSIPDQEFPKLKITADAVPGDHSSYTVTVTAKLDSGHTATKSYPLVVVDAGGVDLFASPVTEEKSPVSEEEQQVHQSRINEYDMDDGEPEKVEPKDEDDDESILDWSVLKTKVEQTKKVEKQSE